jgi:hypothetical protein
MSHFYGGVQGGRTRATRCGHKATGIQASVQSFDGSIGTALRQVGDKVWATITVAHGSSEYPTICLYHGPLEDLLQPAGRLALLRAAAKDSLREAA